MDAHLPMSLRDVVMRFPPAAERASSGGRLGVGHLWPVTT